MCTCTYVQALASGGKYVSLADFVKRLPVDLFLKWRQADKLPR